jgi:ribonucleoside-diphosphate reductase alpha chain
MKQKKGATLDAPAFTPDITVPLAKNAVTVLERRYLVKDDSGQVVETPDEMFHRVAQNLAEAEGRYGGDVAAWEDRFYRLMRSLVFLPNSPTLMNAGRPLQQLSACFVLPVEDDLSAIFATIRHQAIIHQTGGGTGFAFSRLRPKNDLVMTTKGKASGPVSFMQVFDAATGAIKQGGTRRGANMAILSVDHPDIEEFIDMKNDLSVMTNFNVSVALTERFMEAVAADGDHTLVNPHTGKAAGTVKARALFDRIVHRAWQTGEPGIVFIDRINNSASNPTPALGMVESTNPCGEQPLLPYEACNLGSINVGRLVVERDGQLDLDWDALREVVHLSTRALEDVIEQNKYPIPEIEEMTTRNRRIGVGLMGWADLLFRLRIGYNSNEAIALAERMMAFIDEEAKVASEQLAGERGPFANWEESIYGPKGQHWPNAAGVRPLRNSTVSTIAPTGTISIIAGASGGIEPLFSLAFMRTIMDKDKLLEVNEIFEQVAKEEGFYSAELMEEVAATGTLAHIEGVPDWVKRVFVTARDISPEWHTRMQAAFQKHTDNAVSKTVNFPAEATEEEVREVYWLAYELGCKGATIYRDGCRAEQPMSTVAKKAAPTEVAPGTVPLEAAGAETNGHTNGNGHGNGNGHTADPIEAEARAADMQLPVNVVEPRAVLPRPLPDGEMSGWMGRINSPQGTVRLWVSEVDGQPYEAYVVLGKAGSDLTAFAEGIGRMLSIALRSGIPVEILIEQLRGIGGSRSVGFGAGRVLSVPDGIAKLLEGHYFPAERPVAHPAAVESHAVAVVPVAPKAARRTLPASKPLGDLCPECGNTTLMHVEGCKKCPCGHSEC